MDIVEFAEKFLGYQLLAFQKEFLSNCYEACKSNKQLYYIPSRGASRHSLLFMQYIALIYYFEYAEEREVRRNES